MNTKQLIEALVYGQMPQGTPPERSYPDRGLVGAAAAAPGPSGALDQDPDIGLFSHRSRRKRVRIRQDDDDEVFSVVLAVLDQVPTGRR